MKEAYSIIKQSIINAELAEYENYFEFNVCSECCEPVFLRRSHTSENSKIKSSFVHHKFDESSEVCKERTMIKCSKDVLSKKMKSRKQYIRHLELHLWRYLKTNETADLSKFSQLKMDVDAHYGMHIHSLLKTFEEMFRGVEIMLPNIFLEVFESFTEIEKDELKDYSSIIIQINQNNLFAIRQRNIALEMMLLCFASSHMKATREKLYMLCIHPLSLKHSGIDSIIEVNGVTIAKHILRFTSLIFLTSDWKAKF